MALNKKQVKKAALELRNLLEHVNAIANDVALRKCKNIVSEIIKGLT